MTEKKQFEMVDEYLIGYDGDYFDLHKPSDVRSLVKVANYVVKEKEQLKQELISFKQLNIPINKIKETVTDWKGRIVGVYYND